MAVNESFGQNFPLPWYSRLPTGLGMMASANLSELILA